MNRGGSGCEIVVGDGDGSLCIAQAVSTAACQRQRDALWALHQQIIHWRDGEVDKRLSGFDCYRAVENWRVIRTAGLPTAAGYGIADGERTGDRTGSGNAERARIQARFSCAVIGAGDRHRRQGCIGCCTWRARFGAIEGEGGTIHPSHTQAGSRGGTRFVVKACRG